MILSLLLAPPFLASSVAHQNPILPRATAFEIPLISGTSGGMDWGDADRTADHATVAINSDRDILVAYHSTREDIDNIAGHPAFHEPLKQVEIAFFRYDSQNDEWDLTERKLVGSTNHDPRNSAEQNDVRCERPDVIAVGTRFFVVWTRLYDRAMSGYAEEPAILECAWVEWNSSTSTLDIHNGGLTDGLGFPLDDDYQVRECAGVPDAVLLDLGASSSTVGVVYPHQTDFGDSLDGNDNERYCDLRLAVTALTHSTHNIPTPTVVTIVNDILFKGPTAPAGQVAAGIILPDCAQGQKDPSTMAFRFWLAYESQLGQISGNVPDGRIKLELWEQLSSGAWNTLITLNIGSASNPYVRRRPELSSFPEGANGQEFVSLTFGKTNTTNNDDVVHDEWGFDEDTGILSKVARPLGHVFENNSDDHKRPTILHGRNDPLVRILFVDRNEDPSQILAYDIGADSLSVKCGTDISLGRPAVGYHAGSGNVADDIALTWEERQDGVSYDRIWIRVD